MGSQTVGHDSVTELNWAFKLNKQGYNRQPWRTPFLIWNQSTVPCLDLTVTFWPAYRFLRRQVRWSDIPIAKHFPQFVVIYTVKGFGIVNEAEIDVFLELSCFFYDPMDVGNLISGSFFLNPAWTSGSSRFTFCWSLAWRILSVTLFAWDECNCAVVWTFFGIAFLLDWNENWPFPCLVATAEFSKFAGILRAALSQHHLLGFETAQLEFHHLH